MAFNLWPSRQYIQKWLGKVSVYCQNFSHSVTQGVYISIELIHYLFDDLKLTRFIRFFHFCFLSIYFGMDVRFRLLFHSSVGRSIHSFIHVGAENCNRMGFYKTLAGNHIDIVDCWGGWCCGTISFTCFKW